MINDKPLVSILIPCYNHEKYITEALNSVIADTYEPKEIFIINDGSKDRSKAVIESWIDKNDGKVKVHFISRENKGVCFTLNQLVEKSAGKYLVFLASDDALCNNTIAERVQILDQLPSKSVLISDAEMINDEGKIIHKSVLADFHKRDRRNYSTDSGILNEILFTFAISGPMLMVDKQIYQKIGKYPENLKAEDLYFFIRSASLNQIVFQDRIVSKYRWHGGNTSDNNPELYRTFIKTYFKTIRYVPGFINKIKILKRVAGIFLLK